MFFVIFPFPSCTFRGISCLFFPLRSLMIFHLSFPFLCSIFVYNFSSFSLIFFLTIFCTRFLCSRYSLHILSFFSCSFSCLHFFHFSSLFLLSLFSSLFMWNFFRLF